MMMIDDDYDTMIMMMIPLMTMILVAAIIIKNLENKVIVSLISLLKVFHEDR